MKNYVGKKIRGFRFEDKTNGVNWSELMEKYIGKIAKIMYQYENSVIVDFEYEYWEYPISLIEQHLVEEEIPQLGEGVLMEVSDSSDLWSQAYVIAKMADGGFLDSDRITWKYARPIVKEYTKEDLIKIIGHDFTIKE